MLKEQEIIEGNKLVAEFMNFPAVMDQGELMWADWDGMKPVLYHESWSWLMPIVEKIEAIYDEHDGYYGVYIHSNVCIIQGTKLHLYLKDSSYGAVYLSDTNTVFPTKRESTWYQIVQFIKWYNSQTK